MLERSPAVGKLDGKVAIVTGAASGIGAETVCALAEAGARVLVADLNLEGAREVAAGIEARGGRALACRADVAEEDDVRRMVRTAVESFGGLDVLHNNAAASASAQMDRDLDFLNLEVEVWDRAMAVNARGPMLGCKHAVPAMIERGGGSIINTSSVSGLTGNLTHTAYGASKGALNALTLGVATLFGKRGIRCNAIAPGVIQTPSLEENVPAELLAAYEASNLLPRLGRARDIAQAVVFLASDESAYITGQILRVDGGAMSHHPAVAQFRPASD